MGKHQMGEDFHVYGKNDTKPSLFNLLDKSNEIGKLTVKMTDCEQIRDYLLVDQVAKQLISLYILSLTCGEYLIFVALSLFVSKI